VSQSSSGDDDERPNGRGNIAAIIAVVAIAALGYWAFTYLDNQRKMQNCLDSGRHDCAHYVQ
jgi:hypothetical protein